MFFRCIIIICTPLFYTICTPINIPERSISLSIEDEKKATDENALSSRENQEESVEIPTQCAEVPPSTDVDTPFAHAETPLAHAETPLLHAQTPSESSQNITNTYLTESIDACNILYPPQVSHY